MRDLFIENFKGIRAVNPVVDLSSRGVVSAIECSNVELLNTNQSGNFALYTSKGNKAVKDIGKTIVGQFESVQNGVTYWYIFAKDNLKGYLYLYDINLDTITLLKSDLSPSDVCNGITISQGFTDWFVFTNGVDDFLAVNMTQENSDERLRFLNATDAEGRDIRGIGLEVQDGRLVTFCKNRVHWSAQANIFDWQSSDPDVVTSPAYQEFDRDVTAIAYYNNSLITFTDTYSVSFTGNPGDATSFVRCGATGGGCPSFKSVLKFDNKLFYYDHKTKNIYAYYILDIGQTRPTEGLADNVLSFLEKIDQIRLNQIEVLSYINKNKTEIWFKIPLADRNVILVYDYLKREWMERQAQNDICALCVVKDALYSASGTKILKEYTSMNFDGTFHPAQYLMHVINLHSDSNIKILKMPIVITLDFEYDNDFYMEFIFDDNHEKSIIKRIVNFKSGYLIWSKTTDDLQGGRWAIDKQDENGGYWVSSNKSTVMFNLYGINCFKQLQIRIFTQEQMQEFAIKRIEFKRLRVKTKSLG